MIVPLKLLVTKYALPWQQRGLIWQFARREVLGRYRGSFLGLGWTLITPLAMLAVYTTVFVGVFKARWTGAEQGGGTEYALQISAGLLVFSLFAEMVGRAPRLILEQPNLVNKVVFPLEILPWVSLLSSLFHMALTLFVLLVATALLHHGLPWTSLALPLVVLPFLPMLLGLSWLLSGLGVYLRDVGQIIGLVVSLIMFLSPIFYSIRTLSPEMQPLMQANPLTLIIESVRRVMLQGVWPDWSALGLYLLVASIFAMVCARFFDAARGGFADVL